MQTAKPTINFKHEFYDVEIDVINQTKLNLTLIDNNNRIEYSANALQLNNIGANTLIKAFERTKHELKTFVKEVKVGDQTFLEVRIAVESAFLKPVQEIMLLKKTREIGQLEFVKKSVDFLGKKIRDLKESNIKSKITTYYGATLEQKYYNGSAYEPLASVRLPKGKYLLTFNFLLKANNQWIYLYFGQGGALLQNCGYYVPNGTHFIPHTVRKVHTVTQQSEKVSFNTYCASSYPITVRNAIIVAKPILE